MTGEGVATVLREAREAVEAAGLDVDSPAGVAALQILLQRSLDTQSKESNEPPSDEGGDDPASRVANVVGIEHEALRDFFVFEPEGTRVEVPARSLPRSRAEQQRRLTLLKLALDRMGYDHQEVPIAQLLDVCQRYGCRDKNLSRNLESFGNLIVRHGSGRSATYRLTQPGLEEARDVLRQMFNAEG